MTEEATGIPLKQALDTLWRHPLSLVREWNWKAGIFSAMVRGCMFFLLNLHAGRSRAGKAMVVEVVYAMAAAGFAGAVTQRLRYAIPLRQTAGVVFLVIPLVLLAMQAAVHGALGTPKMRSGLVASYVFAAVATGFNWFAMGRGVFLTGRSTSFLDDLVVLPQLLVQLGTSCWRLLSTNKGIE